MVAAAVISSAANAQTPAAGQDPVREAVQELVTVTATRRPFDTVDISAPATVITGATLLARPAIGLDEALRWETGFSLFRRTPARAAHPTTQGVNLRGVAPSGTSRALVLVDGLPLTDAFGGWVYWSRIPTIVIDAVEIVPGGASSTYGNQSLSGTVQILTTAPPHQPRAAVEAAGGGLSTWRVTATVGGPLGGARAIVAAELFDTGGYLATAPEDIGEVDAEVASQHQSAWLGLDFGHGLSTGIDLLHETRANGTAERTNSTRAWGIRGRWSPGSTTTGAQIGLAYRKQNFHSRFSSVAPDRNSERPVLDQQVRSSEVILGATGWRVTGHQVTLGAGIDWRRVEGTSFEEVLAIGLQREPGGSQQIGGIYGAAQWQVTNGLFLEGAARLDGWRNRPHEGGDARSLTALSPRLAAAWHPGPEWTLRGAVYRSFRAPTLNELYRQFRVGNVITRANSELTQEGLTGAEMGLEYVRQLGAGRVRARLHAYLSKLEDGVINATVGAAGDLIFRQRANLGQATIRGIEFDMDVSWTHWTLSASTIWIDSRIDEDPPDSATTVVGNRLPQVPDYRARLAALWQSGRWTADLALHATGAQYEDDVNDHELAAGVTVDAGVRFELRDRVHLGLIAQNLLDRRLQVAHTTVLTLGPPRTVMLRLGWTTR